MRPSVEAVAAAALAALLALHVAAFAAALPPSGDLASYVEAGRRSRWLVDTGFREPAFVLLVRLVETATPLGGAAAGRAASALATLALGAATYALARRAAGPVAALVAGAALATTPAVAAYGAIGDRGPLAALGLVGWALCSGRSGAAAAGAGLAGGVVLLTRLDLLAPLVLLAAAAVGCAADRRRETRRRSAALGIALALAAPYLAANALEHGDPFYPQSLHARFWSNLERLDRAAFETDPYHGGPLGPVAYLLGRAPADLAAGWVRGLGRAFAAYLPRYAGASPLVALAALAGAVVAWRRGLRDLALAVPALLLPYGWLYSLDQVGPGSGVEARFVLHAAPFVHVLAGVAAAAAVEAARAAACRAAAATRPRSPGS